MADVAKLHPDQVTQTDEVTSGASDGAAPISAEDLETEPGDLESSSGDSVVQPEMDEDTENLPGDDQVAEPTDDRVLSLTERRRNALAAARRNGLPPKVDSWRRRTATGAVLTGFALGFREALGLEPQRPAIMMEATGDPPTDLPVDAEVDQIRPADNVVRIRPWLLPNGAEAGTEAEAGDETAELSTSGVVDQAAETAADPAEVDNDAYQTKSTNTRSGYLRRLGRK